MLLTVLDSSGVAQKIVANGQESITDHSGSIATTNVAQDAAPANNLRSGFLFQNLGSNPMYVNNTGDATSTSGSYKVDPGVYFPPPNYPAGVGKVSVMGTAGDHFTFKEW